MTSCSGRVVNGWNRAIEKLVLESLFPKQCPQVLMHLRALETVLKGVSRFESEVLAGARLTKSEFGQVNAQRLGIGTQSLFLNRLQSAGCNAQLDPTIAFCPPKTTLLQIGLLQLLRTDVGMAHGHTVISASTCELTHPRHLFVLLIELFGPVRAAPSFNLTKGTVATSLVASEFP